mmetsp:Transcript_39900/g.116443  ORF Transcript_39900/g.116443 Transcript_39900/m.116443 type:complete len:227 (+) Transcript_39900:163-843(+)
MRRRAAVAAWAERASHGTRSDITGGCRTRRAAWRRCGEGRCPRPRCARERRRGLLGSHLRFRRQPPQLAGRLDRFPTAASSHGHEVRQHTPAAGQLHRCRQHHRRHAGSRREQDCSADRSFVQLLRLQSVCAADRLWAALNEHRVALALRKPAARIPTRLHHPEAGGALQRRAWLQHARRRVRNAASRAGANRAHGSRRPCHRGRMRSGRQASHGRMRLGQGRRGS